MAALTPMTAPVYVDQPPVGTVRYGLMQAANGPLPMPAHGEIGGVQYLQQHCGAGHLWPAASCGTASSNKPLDVCDGVAIGLPFEVIASYKVGAFPRNEAEVEQAVRTRLADNAQFVVEQAFWGAGGSADVADLLHTSGLTPADVTPVPGTAVPIEVGLGLLEQFMAAYSYPGIFHTTPLVSPFLTERLLSVPDGKPGSATSIYRSPMGNKWSFGRGYSGLHPVTGAAVPGTANANAYIVASGPVTVWRDDNVYVNPIYRAMDRQANQLIAIAEQAYAMTIDCLVGFVLVSLNGM